MADKGQAQSVTDKDALSYSGGLGRREYDPAQGRYVEVKEDATESADEPEQKTTEGDEKQ